MYLKNNPPSWIDRSLFPFKSKFIQLPGGKMHFIDEGEGDTILFVHGTPTWSFLYRGFIKELSKTHRCIAIDHIGFGLSDKPKAFSGRPQDHAQNLSNFIKKMDLKNLTLVVHDFGGPIGLAAGIEHAARIKKVVLFNSWLWATKDNEEVQKIDKIVNGWLGQMLYLNFNFSPKVLLKKGFFDQRKLSKQVHKHYIKPFPNKNSRWAMLNIAKALLGSSDWYEDQWRNLDALTDKEWLILWGTEDPFFKDEHLTKWEARLPKATVRKFKSGHFVQEEKQKEAISDIKRFISRKIASV